MSKKALIIIGIVVLAGFFLLQKKPPHNVLLITLDTTRADKLGCYGHDKNTSPHLDQLAEDGVRFDFAIAQAAVTPVSHASILTGLNPYQHGVRVIHGKAGYYLDKKIPTLTSVLKEMGYHTGAFVSAFPVSEYYGFDWAFDRFETGKTNKEAGLKEDGHFTWKIDKGQRRAEVATNNAIKWLKGKQKPFFMWVHYFDPHDTVLLPPKKFINQFPSKTTMELDRIKALYDAEIFYMDQQMGRIIKTLKEMGEYDNTIIVVVGDHGQGLMDHNWMHHRLLYQEQIRLPLVLRTPGGPKGLVTPDLVRSIDIYPTILEILNAKAPEEVEGKSLMGYLRKEKVRPRFAYADAINLLDNNMGKGVLDLNKDLIYCVMDQRWKLIYRQFHPEKNELYDLKEDPKELNNVIDLYPKEKARLMKLFKDTGGKINKLIEGLPENADALKVLNQLGYGK